MEKRTLIALALSFLVLGFYPVVLQKFYPDYYKKTPAHSSANRQASLKSSNGLATQKLVNAEAFLAQEDLDYKNDFLQLIFNKKDGGIREIAFPFYKDSETGKPIEIVSLKKMGVSPAAIVVENGTDSETVSDYSSDVQSDKVVFSASALNKKLSVTKTFEFTQGYSAKLKVRFENTSNSPLEMNYEMVVGSGVVPRHSIDMQYIESNFFSELDGKKNLKHIKENRLGKQVESGHPLRWVAVKDRHFSVIMRPEKLDSMSGIVRGFGAHDFSASLVSPKRILSPNSFFEEEFLIYMGPNELERLLPFGLEDLINFGKFDPIGRLFVGILELIHKVCKNYGISIIALTAMINLALFPLTRVSYLSMKRMQLIQPQINKLRDHHKKNPEKLNKEMMELYKKHKVNPFGGCIPMVAQIPIFISLYVALSKSVDLINAHFLWIKDLSSPDRVDLPFTLPFLGNYIHLLPLLMVSATVIQQRFTQIQVDNQDPSVQAQQKMMTMMMPVIFGFIFYQMPSGLVLYWLTNTLIMASYQLRLKKMTLT